MLASVFVILISMTGTLSAGAAPSKTSAQQPFVSGTAQTYVVLYKTNAVSSDAATVIANAGGILLYSYDKIGVVIAHSNNELFRTNSRLLMQPLWRKLLLPESGAIHYPTCNGT